MIEAITFDFWNTLFKIPADNTVARHRTKNFHEVLQTGGYATPVKDVASAFKECLEYANFCQRAYGREITPTGHVNFILKYLNLSLIPELWDQVYDAYTTTLRQIPPLLNDGVKETLPVLARKYKLAVICNTGVTPGLILREFLRNYDIYHYFQSLAFSDELGWAKPDVKIFNYTLEKIGMEPYRAAHIGDDAITDIIGAKKAGMQAIWLAPWAGWKIPECDYHVRSVKELATLF